jgi:hypothetical protein
MAPISALPKELTLQVFHLLEVKDKISLSATCKYWRAQLAPDIFKTIRLTNKERVAQSVLSAVEAHGQYTTSIEFESCCGWYAPPALPPAAVKVLQGHLTPNVRTVSVRFEYDSRSEKEVDTIEGGSLYPFRRYAFQDADAEEYIRGKEEVWQWRAVLNETYRALAANMHVRELIMDESITKCPSTFRSEEFRQFLSRLESASFDFISPHNDAGYNYVNDGVNFMSNLDILFFHHMTGLKHLTILALDATGLEGGNHTPLPIKPGNLPLLESLKLRNCFVGPELVSFIQHHAQVLKSLDIKDCVAGINGPSDDGLPDDDMANNGITWAEFFNAVYKAKPALTELNVGYCYLRNGDELEPDYRFEDEPENLQEIRRKLKADPSLRWLAYGYIDYKYLELCLADNVNEERFESGNDQTAFDRLMGLVIENAAKTKKRSWI